MLSPARRASPMPRSAIREIMALAAERQDVIHRELGEPDLPTPDHIVAEAFAAGRLTGRVVVSGENVLLAPTRGSSRRIWEPDIVRRSGVEDRRGCRRSRSA